jgi:hypothetical protein
MTVGRAILIQDIQEFIHYIKPYFEPILEAYPADEEDIVKWIIAEEIEMTYNLFDINHIHNRRPHINVRDYLDTSLPTGLSKVFSWYIKAPRIYSDHNEIEIVMRGRDLYIQYFAEMKQFNYSFYL